MPLPLESPPDVFPDLIQRIWTGPCGLPVQNNRIPVYPRPDPAGLQRYAEDAALNPSFETNLTNWNAVAPNTIARVSTRAYDGTWSAELTWVTAGTSNVGYTSGNTIDVGTWYFTIAIWIPASFDGTGVSFGAENFTGGTTPAARQANMALRDQWQVFPLNYVIPASADLVGDFVIRATGTLPTNGKKLWIDGFMLTKTPLPAPFVLEESWWTGTADASKSRHSFHPYLNIGPSPSYFVDEPSDFTAILP